MPENNINTKGLIDHLMDKNVDGEVIASIMLALGLDALNMNEYRNITVREKVKSIAKHTGVFRDWVWENYDERKHFLEICIAVEQQQHLFSSLYNWAVKDGLIKGELIK